MENLDLNTIIERIHKGYYNHINEPLMIIFEILMDIDDGAVINYQMEKGLEAEISHLVDHKVFSFNELIAQIKKMDNQYLEKLTGYLPEASSNGYIQYFINVIKGKLNGEEFERSEELDGDTEVALSHLFVFLYNERRFGQGDGKVDVFVEAIMNDDIHIFEAFVTNDEVNLEYRNYYNESFLHLAARHNSVKIIEYLLAWGLDPNVRNVYNNTPAFMALFEEKYEALQLLIEKGADLTIKNDDGVTVTEIAIIQDKVDVLRYILEQRQRKHNGIVYDPYILAIQHQALNVLNYLMSINYPTKERIEVIFFSACQNGQIEIIELLLKHGLSVNTYYKKRTPLFWAVAGRQLEATKYLLDQGADPNPKGYSPLALAAAEGNIDLVKLLVDYGANPHYQNRKQLTPLMMAVYYGRLEVVQYLVELGVDVNQVDVRKLTPLAVAAEAGQYEIAEYLLQKGATIVPKTHSPVKMAIRFGQHQILELLFNHGFSLDKRDMKFSDLNMMMAQSKKRKNNFLDQALSNALEDKNNIRVCDFVLNVFKRYQRELVITALLFLALIIFILSITFNTYKTYRHFSIESEKIFAHITSINNNNREVTYTYTIDSNVIHSKSEVSEGVLNELQLNEYVEILYKTNNVHDSILVKQHSTNQSGFIAGLVVAGIFMLIDLVYFIWIRKERKYVNQLYNRQTDQHQVQ